MKGVASWPENTEVREVILSASDIFPTQLLLLAAADKKRDAAAMKQVCDEIRRVATRIDGYRRMKERKWSEQEKHKNASHDSD